LGWNFFLRAELGLITSVLLGIVRFWLSGFFRFFQVSGGFFWTVLDGLVRFWTILDG
jgi:hypothetical protein